MTSRLGLALKDAPFVPAPDEYMRAALTNHSSFDGSFDAESVVGVDILSAWRFTLTEEITVRQLGCYARDVTNGDGGLVEPNKVGIYRVSDKVLLASVTIPTSGALRDGEFLYKAIAPLTLPAADYLLACSTGATGANHLLQGYYYLGNGAFLNLFTTVLFGVTWGQAGELAYAPDTANWTTAGDLGVDVIHGGNFGFTL